MYAPQEIRLTKEDDQRIKELAYAQTCAYGHDRGFFTLGRVESSHQIGFEGEVGFVRYCKDVLRLKEPEDVGLNEMGGQYDAYVVVDGERHNVHIKTGRWTRWPSPHWYFGVHYGQGIEDSGAPVVLVSYLKDDASLLRIEGFMPSEVLARQKIIRRGECFPGMKYPSRTDNWLTRFGDYWPITEMIKYFKGDVIC